MEETSLQRCTLICSILLKMQRFFKIGSLPSYQSQPVQADYQRLLAMQMKITGTSLYLLLQGFQIKMLLGLAGIAI